MIVILVTAAAVVIGGLFLKWATWPCLLAYDLGRKVGQVVAWRQAGRDITMVTEWLAREGDAP
jgi:hypothetical protein